MQAMRQVPRLMLLVGSAVLTVSTARAEDLETLDAGAGHGSYEVVDLGTIDGRQSLAYGINARGDVAGTLLESEPPQVPFFKPEHGPMQIPGAPGVNGLARDLTNTGAIAGAIYKDFHMRATIWTRGGSIIDVHALLPAGAGDSMIEGVNERLTVVGNFLAPGPSSHAFISDLRSARDLGEGNAFDVNDLGVAVGGRAGDPPRAVLWWPRQREPLVLGTLGGWGSSAQAINNAGEVTGYADIPPPESDAGGAPFGHAFLWTHQTGMRDLGTLVPGRLSAGEAINARGDVVGWAHGEVEYAVAILVRRGQPMRDLNTLIDPEAGWILRFAHDINDEGEIVGEGEHHGAHHAFLLRPRRGRP